VCGEWPPPRNKRPFEESEPSAHQKAIEELQNLLELLRPKRSKEEWSVGEKLHLVLHQWLGDDYPLQGVLPSEKMAKASKRWTNMQQSNEKVAEVVARLKAGTGADGALAACARLLRTAKGRGELIAAYGGRMERPMRADESEAAACQSEEESATEDAMSLVSAGSRVVVFGLIAHAHANQSPGIVQGYNASSDRYTVRVGRRFTMNAHAAGPVIDVINVRRDNFVIVRLASMEDWIHASVRAVNDEQCATLAAVHGSAAVHALVAVLSPSPSEKTYGEDLSLLVDNLHRAKTRNPCMRSVASQNGAKRAALPAAQKKQLVKLRARLTESGHAALATTFIGCSPDAAPHSELLCNYRLRPLRMPYSGPLFLMQDANPTEADAWQSAPLPFGACYNPSYTEGGRCGMAAYLPCEWPVRIAPTQMAIRSADGQCVPIPHAYVVSGVTNATLLSTVLEDVRAFVRRWVKDSNSLTSIRLLRQTRDTSGECTYQTLNETSAVSADDVDLFNLANADDNFEDDTGALPCECLVVTNLPVAAPLVTPTTTPNAPLTNAITALRLAQYGLGTTRPNAPDHNTLANALCNARISTNPELQLPTRMQDYQKVGACLKVMDEQPHRCCFNCGMMNYHTRNDTILVRARRREDLRAWRVYGAQLQRTCEELAVPLEHLFLCERADDDANGVARCRVFSCSACKKETCQRPEEYDLFDGHTRDERLRQRRWRYDANGVGEPLPDALDALTSEERLMLGVVKMANVAFDAAYSNTGYMHFSNGGFLQPGDYHGLSTILTCDPEQTTTPQQARLRTALEHLMHPLHGNPLVRDTLTCFEREVSAGM
tara:strand:+ start:323 stop:2818 length:2496 start_codon:yes stop_codon:yes gene_type:complete